MQEDEFLESSLQKCLESFIDQHKHQLLNNFSHKYSDYINDKLSELSKNVLCYYFSQYKEDVHGQLVRIIQERVDEVYGTAIKEKVEEILLQEKTLKIVNNRIEEFIEYGADRVIETSIKKKINQMFKDRKIKIE